MIEMMVILMNGLFSALYSCIGFATNGSTASEDRADKYDYDERYDCPSQKLLRLRINGFSLRYRLDFLRCLALTLQNLLPIRTVEWHES